MNTNTNPYARKVGFFGSLKQLGVTTISGANTIVQDTVTTATGVTGSTAIVSTAMKSAVDIWGNNLLEDLQADQQLDRVHREIAQLQQNSELEALKATLAKEQARTAGRPKGSTNKAK